MQNKPQCPECGGNHERTGARIDCLRHWKLRAVEAENKLNIVKSYILPDILEARKQQIFTHEAHNWLAAFERRLMDISA